MRTYPDDDWCMHAIKFNDTLSGCQNLNSIGSTKRNDSRNRSKNMSDDCKFLFLISKRILGSA